MNVFLLPALGKWGVARFPPIHPQRDPVFLFVLGWLFLFIRLFLHQSGNWVSVGGIKLALRGGGAPSTCFSLVSTVLASVKRQYSL